MVVEYTLNIYNQIFILNSIQFQKNAIYWRLKNSFISISFWNEIQIQLSKKFPTNYFRNLKFY